MNSIRLAALAAAIAAALPAAAQQRPVPAAARPPRGSAAPAAPMAPQAPVTYAAPASSDEAPAPEWRVGPGLGFEFGMGDLDYGGPKLRIEAARVFRRLSPVSTVSLVGSFSMTHASGSEDLPIVIPAFPVPIVRSAKLEWDANVFEVVPAARITYSASPTISFYADGGAGVVYTAARVHLPPVGSLGDTDLISDGAGGVVRLAAGLVFNPSPALRLSLEAMGLHVRFGEGPGTGFALGACLSHRL